MNTVLCPSVQIKSAFISAPHVLLFSETVKATQVLTFYIYMLIALVTNRFPWSCTEDANYAYMTDSICLAF